MSLTITHAADFYRRYPGETVTFFTRVTPLEAIPGFTLRISLPPELSLDGYHLPAHVEPTLPQFEIGGPVPYLLWRVEESIPAGTVYEYRLEARVAPVNCDTFLESHAIVTAGTGRGLAIAEETVTVAVNSKGRYLHHLPALYDDDGLMGRFLMLFESFWKPIEGQIEQMSLYFDPKMTPPDFLPWLASWIGLVLDEHWPEERQRRLLCAAASLYRRRGTKSGLQEFLEIYTDRPAQITENRAENFGLGPGTKLGPAIALGRENQPHTFSVLLRLPPLQADTQAERARQELVRQRTIEAIIEAEKPAQTSYTLHIELEERE